MWLSAAIAIRNILDKPKQSLKRDSVFRDITFDIRQLEYYRIEVKRHLSTEVKGTFNILPFVKMKETNKILRECYEIISLKSLNRN